MNTPPLSPEERQALLKHLNAVQGYLHLGMEMDAWNELENIPAEQRGRPEVLKIRADVSRSMKKWELVVEITNHLAKIEPNDPRHPVNLAAATRKIEGEQDAADILEQARSTFPNDAVLAYNLACYRAVLGRVDEAKKLLAEAVRLDSSLRPHSLDDPDLAVLWDSI